MSDGTPKGMMIGAIHIVLIIAAYASPFWLDWKIILAGAILLSLQFLILGGCLLNTPQYGEEFYENGNGLYERLFTSLGIKYDQRRLKFILDWVMPSTILVIALIWQLVLGFSPLIKF